MARGGGGEAMSAFSDRAAWIVEDEAGGQDDLALRVGRVRQLLWASGATWH